MAIFNPYIEASRDLVLVGHDTMQDVHYLAQMGIDVTSMKSVSRILDSQKMHQAWRNFDNGRGLGAVLSELDISHCHLHNAGNDAVFTLRAAFGVAIRQMQEKAEITQTGAQEESAGTELY
jgi:DNA polymerase III alpha subunit (gram-positive type)